MRLDRWLTSLALGSRSQVAKLIRAGQVTLDGVRVTDPAFAADPAHQALTVNGEAIDGRLARHAILNKPSGLLTAARDARQPTVMSLFPAAYASLGCMPIGRLDKDTTGLLLFTTDGELNHRLLSPGRHVDKVYEATVEGQVTEAAIEAFAAGMEIGEDRAAPAKLVIRRADVDTSDITITLHEGKFHQVKRMCEAVGHPVITLRRTAFGPLSLPNDLPEGTWRELTATEYTALLTAAGMDVTP